MEIVSYKEVNIESSAVALGKFQGIHKGHMLLIDKIRELSNTKGVKSVLFTVNMGNDSLITVPCERYNILSESGVDYAVECNVTPEFMGMKYDSFIKDILLDKLHAKYIVVGEDFRFGYKREGNVSILEEYGKKYGFTVIAYKKLVIDDNIVSSSLIRQYIQKGKMELVKKYMGRNICYSGIVSCGKKIGRTIDFPTVNIMPDKNKILPPMGVYKSKVIYNNKEYAGITNIGNNPTISDNNDVIIETHILDFSCDIYGSFIVIELEKYIRSEMKFENLNALKKQIKIDIETVMHQ